MAKLVPRQRGLLILAIVVLCLHFTADAVFKAESESVSYLFFVICSGLGLFACCFRAIVTPSGLRRNWMLVSLGLLFWFVATLLAARAEFFEHANPYAATIDDFFYFFYGVPILLVIVSQDEPRSVSIFFWLDGLQAAVAGYLAYIVIFGTLPFSGVATHPMSVTHLILIYDVENIILALAATARLTASPRGSEERRVFKILVAYLWIYAVCSTVYNRITAVELDAGLLDFMVDIPFLLLFVTASRASRPLDVPSDKASRKPLILLLDNSRPVVFALALVALSALVAEQRFAIGMGSILFAFVVYGLRSTILQSRYLQAQHALEIARDRLEEIAMLDGLTGIANRRCFDMRLQSEWNRAFRAESTLSLLMIDIDYFKKLNDTHGHQVGDECLTQVATILRTALHRPGDLLARYGGEEFVALLPETDSGGAKALALHMQSLIGASADSLDYTLTISVGVTTWYPCHGGSPALIVDTADRAMYLAKQNGRDRVEVLDFLPIQSSK